MAKKAFEQSYNDQKRSIELEETAHNYVEQKYIGTFWQRQWQLFVASGVLLLFITISAVLYPLLNEDIYLIVFLGSFGFSYFVIGMLFMFFFVIGAIKYLRQRAYLSKKKKILHIAGVVISYSVVMVLFFRLSTVLFEEILNAAKALDESFYSLTLYYYGENADYDVFGYSFFLAFCLSVITMVGLSMIREILKGYGLLPEGIKSVGFFESLRLRGLRGAVERYVKDTKERTIESLKATIDKLLSECHRCILRAEELADSTADAHGLLRKFKNHQVQLIKRRKKIIIIDGVFSTQIMDARGTHQEDDINFLKRIIGKEDITDEQKERFLKAHQKILDHLSTLQELNKFAAEIVELSECADTSKADLDLLNKMDAIFQNSLSMRLPNIRS